MAVNDNTKLISIFELINRAREAGFIFGSGAPSNRIRYWSTIGLIAHAKRQRYQVGNSHTTGYYPESTVKRLLEIQSLKNAGLSISQIKEQLKRRKEGNEFKFSEKISKSQARELISIHELITTAAASGFSFGQGEPENRIRYWSSVGLIDHAKRRRIASGDRHTVSFYPRSVVSRLLHIQALQKQGISVADIKSRLDLATDESIKTINQFVSTSNQEDEVKNNISQAGKVDYRELSNILDHGVSDTKSKLINHNVSKLNSDTHSNAVSAEKNVHHVFSKNTFVPISMGMLVGLILILVPAFFYFVPGGGFKGETSLVSNQKTEASSVGEVLAESAVNKYLQINALLTEFQGKVQLSGSADGFSLFGGETERRLTVVGSDVGLDQDLMASSSPAFSDLTLNNSVGQITFPQAAGVVVLDQVAQTLLNKTISGSNNTFSSIPNSALSSSKFTINTSGSLTGGGEVSLGGSISLSASGGSGTTSTASAGFITLQTVGGNLGNSVLSQSGGVLQVDGIDAISVGSYSCVITTNGLVTASGTCPSGGSSKWQLNTGVLSPNDVTQSLTIGATSTASAKFYVNAITGRIVAGGSGTNSLFINGGNETTTGQNNIAVGSGSLALLGTGQSNIAIGSLNTLSSLTSGVSNLAIGNHTGSSVVGTSGNVFLGDYAGNDTTGSSNIFIGWSAGEEVTSGDENICIGNGTCLYGGSTIDGSVIIGDGAGINVTSFGNLILGYAAGQTVETGSSNVLLGPLTDVDDESYSESIALGYGAYVRGNNQMVIGSGGSEISNVYIGEGVIDTSPISTVINATGGRSTDVGGANLTLAGGKGTGNAVGGSVIFSTSTVGTTGSTLQTLSERMRINSLGYVGIGTSVPLATFDVRGQSGIISLASISGATSFAGLVIDNSVGDLITASSSGMNRFVIRQNGNVGIGTSQPNSLFQVKDYISFPSSETTLIGYLAGNVLSGSDENTFIGHRSGVATVDGDANSFIGAFSGEENISGSFNTFLGQLAGADYTIGDGNTFVGSRAGEGQAAASGDNNTSVGYTSGINLSTGYENVIMGYSTGQGLSTGFGNTLLGSWADVSSGAFSESIALGTNAYITASNQLVIGGFSSEITDAYIGEGVTNSTPASVVINATGGSGSDIVGANLTLAGGKGTGAGVGGSLIFSTSITGASGSTLQNLGERMRINTVGLVGINNTSPAAVVDIRGVGTQTLSGTIPVASISGATSFAGLVVDNAIGDLFTASSSGLSRFVITQNGNVGIGTTVTSEKLEIAGDIRLSYNGGVDAVTLQAITGGQSNALLVSGTGGLTIGAGANAGSSITTFSNGGGVNSVIMMHDASFNTDVVIHTGGDSYFNGGNLGIGTTSPLARLHVQTANGVSSVASISGATSFASLVVDNSGVGDLFTASTSGLTRFLIDNNGNVGIGDNFYYPVYNQTLSEKLIVKGNIGLLGNDSETRYIKPITRGVGSVNLTVQGGDNSNDATGGTLTLRAGASGVSNGGNVIIHATDASGGFVVPFDGGNVTIYPGLSVGGGVNGKIILAHTGSVARGNVGIGTSSPTALLSVGSSSQLTVDSSGNLTTSGTVAANGGTISTSGSSFNLVNTNAATLNFAGASTTLTIGATTGTLALRNAIADIQGVISNSTSRGLNMIPGSVAVNDLFTIAASSAAYPAASISANTGQAALVIDQQGTGDLLTASSSGLSRFVVSQSGNVGIGSTAPDLPLVVSKLSGNGSNQKLHSVTGNAGQYFLAGASGWAQFTSATYNFFQFWSDTASASVVAIEPSGGVALGTYTAVGDNPDGGLIVPGNVGLGTSSPLFKLQVSDSQTATGTAMIVNTSTGSDADGLIVKLGFTGTGSTTNSFMTFLDGSGRVNGLIRSTGANGVAYQTSGIADFGEYLKSEVGPIEAGTVVCHGVNGVKPCESSAKIAGVVSDSTAFLGGIETPDSVIVGFVGQVNVKVASGSSDIKAGDAITALGTKATKSGMIVGHAVNDQVGDKVLVLVRPGYSVVESDFQALNTIFDLNDSISNSQNIDISTISGNLKVLGQTQLADTSIGGKLLVGLLTFDDLDADISSLTENLSIQNGSVIIGKNGDMTTSGNFEAKSVTAGKINVLGDQNSSQSGLIKASIGTIYIEPGEVSKVVQTTSLTSQSKVFVSVEEEPIAVSARRIGKVEFEVKIKEPQNVRLTVNWWVVN